MVNHTDLGKNAVERSRAIWILIHRGDISLGGYRKGKIYGLLSCSSGKRMKTENRIFFKDEQDAINNGYRPCGHCMKNKYAAWKKTKKQ